MIPSDGTTKAAKLSLPTSHLLRQSIVEFCWAWQGVHPKIGLQRLASSAADLEAERWRRLAHEWTRLRQDPGLDARYAANLAAWWLDGKDSFGDYGDRWHDFSVFANRRWFTDHISWGDPAKRTEGILDFCSATLDQDVITSETLGLDIQRSLFRPPFWSSEKAFESLILGPQPEWLDIEF